MNVCHGTLTVIDADGRAHTFSGAGGPVSTVRLTDPALHFRLFHNAQLAMGEAYVDGTLRIEEGTLYDFIDIRAANQRHLETAPLQRMLGVVRNIHAAARTRNPIGPGEPRRSTPCR
jgi:cyclopropane-fatty-acyl-phospholipid synthase